MSKKVKKQKQKQNCIDRLPLHQVERSFCLEQGILNCCKILGGFVCLLVYLLSRMTQGKLRAPFPEDRRIVSAYTRQQSVFRLQHTALTIIFWVLNLNPLGSWNILTLTVLSNTDLLEVFL